MKPKFLLCLAAVILLNPAFRVLGSTVIISVNSTNIQTLPFVVKTEKVDYGEKILFRVIADPKGAPYAPDDNMHFSLGGASLSVYDGTNCISSCSVAGQKVPSNMQDVKPPLTEKGVLFEFTVGTNYLRSVEFQIGYGSSLHPAIDIYRFALQTFVPAADTGLLPGVKDNQSFKKQIFDILTECQKIKPGMTRAELLKTFTTEGGLSSAMHRSFVYRGCPYIKVDVEFTLSEPRQTVLEERPTDTISKISKPYLEWSIND